MKERRPLIEGLKPEPEVDPKAERDFVFTNKAKAPAAPPAKAPTQLSASTINPAAQSARVPVTARLPADMAHALKRASFERQLQAIEPNTLQDIVEEALTPWLRKHGYLP